MTELDTIVQAIKANQNHILINASAGSGKTYTLAYILNNGILPKDDTLVLAFNKDAAKELNNRIPNGNISTHHAMGLKIILSNKWKLNDIEKSEKWKCINVANKIHGTPKDTESKSLMYKSLSVYTSVSENLRCNAILKPTIEDIRNALYNPVVINPKYLTRFKDIDMLENNCLAYHTACNGSKNPWGAYEVNFSDMVWYPYYFDMAVPKYKYLLIDEVQDYSPLFLAVIEKFLKQGTRIIAVGDTYQSIYGWRGAIKAMDKLKDLLNRY